MARTNGHLLIGRLYAHDGRIIRVIDVFETIARAFEMVIVLFWSISSQAMGKPNPHLPIMVNVN